MIDRREAIEKSKTMKRTIFYLFCIWGLIVSSAVAQKRTVSHETGTFVGESSAERPERRVSVSPDGVTVTYEFKQSMCLPILVTMTPAPCSFASVIMISAMMRELLSSR